MTPFVIKAVNRKTNAVIAVARIDKTGSAKTEVSKGVIEDGLSGPFASIAFHVGHTILDEMFGDDPNAPAFRELLKTKKITDGDIAMRIPETYQNHNFIKSNEVK